MSGNKVADTLKTSVEGKDLVMELLFDAPRELVFRTYADAEHLTRWWGPKGWQTEIRTFEFRPNGVWHYCMECVDKNQGEFFGQQSWGKSVFQEIVEPERIVYTDAFSDENGNVVDGMPEMRITITFGDDDGGTKLTIRSEFESEENLKQVMDMGVVEGFTSQLERLDELLDEMK